MMVICNEDEVPPGTMREFVVDGVTFLVVRGSDGATIVVPPTCPHMFASLSDGFFDGELLTCAKHLWQWQARDGKAAGIAEKPLQVYEHTVDEGRVVVRFNGELTYEY